MENYTRNEKIDMLLIYGEAKKNASDAARIYAQRFPNRRHPTRHYFPKLEKKMRNEPEENANKFIVSEEKEVDVLAYVEVNCTASIRQIVSECDISYSSVWRILHKYNYRSFKYQLHQHLYDNDHNRRLTYCNWFLTKYREDVRFPFKIIYSDETRFTNLGLFNRNNKRYWSQTNLHLMQEGNFQERFGFNCWMGIIGGKLLGPIIFDGQLTGEKYLQFLRNQINDFIEDLPLATQVDIYFQQDGAPPHNSQIVREHLNDTFPEKWIGTNGPIQWPARSPDLTPLDFFLWGTIKNQVYNTTSATREELEYKVRVAFQNVTAEQLNNVVRATIDKVELCRDQGGGHFENLET